MTSHGYNSYTTNVESNRLVEAISSIRPGK